MWSFVRKAKIVGGRKTTENPKKEEKNPQRYESKYAWAEF